MNVSFVIPMKLALKEKIVLPVWSPIIPQAGGLCDQNETTLPTDGVHRRKLSPILSLLSSMLCARRGGTFIRKVIFMYTVMSGLLYF